MDFDRLLTIQTELNDFTLASNKVYAAVDPSQLTGPLATPVLATMGLAQREGTFIRHHSPVVQLIDMYQWAGNRELAELLESDNVHNNQNSRVEVVDIMHFDLSILALTKTTGQEIADHFEKTAPAGLEGSLGLLLHAREVFDNLQLRKWWTTKTITLTEIRAAAIEQFVRLLDCALQYPLFTSLEDIEKTYLQKVEVNYARVKVGYNHVTNKEMGNDTIK